MRERERERGREEEIRGRGDNEDKKEGKMEPCYTSFLQNMGGIIIEKRSRWSKFVRVYVCFRAAISNSVV